ncbi:DUF6544 family protein [Candidatus Izemoplasma sp. B36]|uniref:DUF6544 family protein n=1 Tax=Candidatus Izemoplasma sp. B36 TaxID=3242468 RepID=UPI003556073D
MKLILKIIISIVVLSIVTIVTISLINFTKREYNSNIKRLEEAYVLNDLEEITEDDLIGLPDSVKNYLNYVGVVGTNKVHHFKADLSLEFKATRDGEFVDGKALQTSYINPATRLFYMTLKMNGLKVVGLHHFENAEATMKIKLLDILTVTNAYGIEMNKAETVTMFNDMCLLAPSTLIDERISWEEIDQYHVRGTFINQGISISAILTFDESYRLINFYSEDRYYANSNGEMEQVPWSTPITEYKLNNGLNLPYYGSAIWHFETEDYTYIKMYIKNITFNG